MTCKSILDLSEGECAVIITGLLTGKICFRENSESGGKIRMICVENNPEIKNPAKTILIRSLPELKIL